MKYADFRDELKVVYVSFDTGIIEPSEIIEWAGEVLSRGETVESDTELLLLYGLDVKATWEFPKYFIGVVDQFIPEFKTDSEEASAIGHRILIEVCQKYIANSITPDALCRYIPGAEERFRYPSWLGNLYGGCSRQDNEPRKRREPDLIADECRAIIKAFPDKGSSSKG